jgi:hypothetical protein
MLEGRQCVIMFALGKSSEPWTARQQKLLSYIVEFSSDSRHLAGR